MRKLLTAALSLIACASAAFAQSREINGVVTGSGEPLAGASLVSATGAYAVTDLDGKFTLKASTGEAVTVNFFGFEDYVLTVGEGSTYSIDMKPSATVLDETVVIGYGTTTKQETTGAVSSLQSDDSDKGSFTDPAGLLQGKVAGLTVTNPNGGDPNGSFEIILRGTNTLSAGQGPLVIIDGVVGADMSTINFQEVESIDVLKDGSAAAIYGTRGTNGVIIITTKRAKAGKTSVEYDGQVSVQTVLSRAVPMTAREFAYTIDNFVPTASNLNYGADTDWFKEVTRTPISHRHSLAIAGGSEKFSHRTVLNFEQNQGILKNNNVDKFLAKTNIHQEALNGWVTFDVNLLYAKRKYDGARYGIFRQAFLHNPTEPVYDPNDKENGGYFTIESMDYYNPVAMINERSSKTDVDRYGANGRITLNILPVKGLKWDNFVSYNGYRYDNYDYKTKYYPGETGMKGQAEVSNAASDDIQFESTLQYGNTFGKHNVQAILGYTFQEQSSRDSYLYNYGFDTDYFQAYNIGAGSAIKAGVAEMSSSKESNRYIAFFGRVMYNYAEKYLISASLRRDGSSRFGKNNKWGWFPAVSVGWRLTGEDWLKDVKGLDELKLRAGYGVTGNQDFENYKSMFLVKTSGSFYYNGAWQNSYAPASNANPDLAWEKKAEFNVGVDFSFLEGRISGAIDYYYRNTTNLLYNYSVPVPPYDYSQYFTNVGAISNQGIELLVTAIPVLRKNFRWTTSLTFAHNSNKLTKFTNEEFQGQEYRTGWLNTPLGVYCQRLVEGESIGTFYGPQFKNIKSNGSIAVRQTDESDWINLGTAYPICNLGWSNNFKYKDLSISATFRASIGGKVFNQMRAVYENISEFGQKNILATWLDNTNYTGKVSYCDRYLEDASFLKLDNVSVAYDFHFKDMVIKGLTLYLTGQNLLTVTGYKGVDPEVSLGGLAPGVENLTYYPRTRVFTFGVKLKF
ncbi:MAG: SusC/RagA family TonB-linked outer membrane protein [Bacteroidales bacterium]|nr:SusC/RagA family TonB-linked outer membrane protein [Bacteroidales bacterium]